jgi:hypothetical protein
MRIKQLVPLLKIFVIAIFMLSVSNAYAEYYLVYSDSQYVASCNTCSTRHYVRHRYHRSCYTPRRYHHRYYSNRSSHLDMKVYYVWRVYPSPYTSGCGTKRCKVRYYAGCSGACNGDFYTGNYNRYAGGDSYSYTGCANNYSSGNCYRSAKPGYYVPCNNGCNSSSCSTCQYQSNDDGYNDYNYDMRTADDTY